MRSVGIQCRRSPLITEWFVTLTPWPSGSDEKKVDTVIARSLGDDAIFLAAKTVCLAMTNPRVPLTGDGAKGMIHN
jgi:hypothetical protein